MNLHFRRTLHSLSASCPIGLLVKPHDPDNRSRKHAKYLPFWA